MKTIQVGKGKVQVLQFENLKEIQSVYSDAIIVDYFNASLQVSFLKRKEIEKVLKEVKK